MDWCVDTTVPGAVALMEDDLCAHLTRHATDMATVELSRPVVGRLLADSASAHQVLCLSVDWTDEQAAIRMRPLSEPIEPSEQVGPGVTRHGGPPPPPSDRETTVTLGVSRRPETDIDLPGADRELVEMDRPATVLGLLASELTHGRSLEEAAARAGATVAAHFADEVGPDTPAQAIAEQVVAAERAIGADFEVLAVTENSVTLRGRRCPFGPAAPSATCRFTSALAGSLAARTKGEAHTAVLASMASGDPECRLHIAMKSGGKQPSWHRYTWPPSRSLPGESGSTGRKQFQITLSLQLPRDRVSVPVTRHLIRAAMDEVGVVEEDADAVDLAVTEACANVIDHSGPGDAYDVAVSITPEACHIRVVDIGRGFDSDALDARAMAGSEAEHGRGLALMQVLVDQVRFSSEPEKGTVVHLVKRLRFKESAPGRRLAQNSG